MDLIAYVFIGLGIIIGIICFRLFKNFSIEELSNDSKSLSKVVKK